MRSASLWDDAQQRTALSQLEQLNRIMTDYNNIPIYLPRPQDYSLKSQSSSDSDLENTLKSRGREADSRVKPCGPEDSLLKEDDDEENDTHKVLFVCPM